jgi:hypothetical protein
MEPIIDKLPSLESIEDSELEEMRIKHQLSEMTKHEYKIKDEIKEKPISMSDIKE